MLSVGQARVRNCEGVSRRELLQVGGLSLLGTSLAGWHANQAVASTGSKKDKYAKRDAACIFLWLDGGPSHFETFDPKPDTPDAIRGPFGTIPTSVSGVHFCE